MTPLGKQQAKYSKKEPHNILPLCMVQKACKSVSLLADGSYSIIRKDGTAVEVTDKVFISTTLLAETPPKDASEKTPLIRNEVETSEHRYQPMHKKQEDTDNIPVIDHDSDSDDSDDWEEGYELACSGVCPNFFYRAIGDCAFQKTNACLSYGNTILCTDDPGDGDQEQLCCNLYQRCPCISPLRFQECVRNQIMER